MNKKGKLIGRFRNFINSITKDDVVAVLHHTDPDGVCSGVIMAKLVEKIRGKKIDLHINQAASEIAVLDSTVEALKNEKVNRLIITDLGVDQNPANIKEIEKFAEILVIDHHKVYNDISSERTIFLKPQFISGKKPASYPTAKLCFDLASEMVGMDDVDWVAAVGLIGDCAFNEWKEFLDSVFRKYRIEKKQDIFGTELGSAASLISCAESFDSANASKAFEILYDSSGTAGILNSPLQRYHEIVASEISYWEEHVNEFAEFFDDISLIFYLIKPKYKIKAPLSTRLSLKYPHKTIIVVQDTGKEIVGISARRRDEKVAVNELLEGAVKGLEKANAGGHIPAAGGKVRKEDLQKFKENIANFLKNG
jgi:single-stranded DNA-specific DHH superfamily exonuclease